MASVKSLSISWNGGEVTPEFWGKLDDAKYQSGAATLRNFIALTHGPARNRPGLEFVRKAKANTRTRLIPFVFSVDQTMVLEFGNGYIRFHTDGETLLAPAAAAYNGATAYTLGNLVSSGGTTYYCIASTTGNAPPNATYWYTLPATGEYEIPAPYAAADLSAVHYTQSMDVLTLVHTSHAPRELRRYGATDWRLVPISFASDLSAPGSVTATATVGTGSQTHTYVVVATNNDVGVNKSLQSSSANCTNDLLTTGNYNTVGWGAVSGATRYWVYKESNGLFGYIGQTDSLSFIDDNIAPDMGNTPPEQSTPFTGAGNYPGAVAYFEQRRLFAGTTNKPQNFWTTRSGTESDLSYSIPTKDDDAISGRVAARESSIIRHIVPMANVLLLTNASEFRLSSANDDYLTPPPVVRPQSFVGANNVQPVVVNNNMIYAANRGGHMREMAYSWQHNGFVNGDLCLRAPHLFDGYTITDLAVMKSPYSIVWAVSSSGQMLGMTYTPEQEVLAWHRHDTDGTFESVCVVPEGDEDRLYVVVTRTIDGVEWRYIERMAVFAFGELEDAFFVDCGATYHNSGTFSRSGTTMTCTIEAHGLTNGNTYAFWFDDDSFGERPDGTEYVVTVTGTDTFTIPVPNAGSTSGTVTQLVTTISGIDWLEGEDISILADGAVHPRKTVASGAFTLDSPASKVHFGLPITADLQTLPLVMQIKDGALGQGRMKNINKVWLRAHRSSGIWLGASLDKLTMHKQRTNEPYGAPPSLVSDEIEVTVLPQWNNTGGQLYVRQADPLPLTVLSLALEVSIGG